MQVQDRCIFCEIARGLAPASIVYRDDSVIAFLDIHPRNPGHTLVVPVAHYACLAELPESISVRMFTLAQRVAAAIRQSGLHCDGISLGLADGAAAGQEVPHCHFHVRPRFFGDARRVPRWPTRTELNAVADQLRASL